MRIFIAGGNGFIGRYLGRFLTEKEMQVIVPERKDFVECTLKDKLSGCDVLINLIGESISGIWTQRKKRKIYDSRILNTRKLVDLVNVMDIPVTLFINISGASLYGHEHIHDESSTDISNDFLSRVIVDWEKELSRIERKDIRIVILRMGIVLGNNGGILKEILKLFKFGFGFTVSSVEKFPVVHVEDVLEIVDLIIRKKDIHGVMNVVLPEPVNIHDFFLQIIKILKIKFWINFPPSLLKFVLGESSVILTRGQHVIPKRLLESGYSFKYQNTDKALKSLLSNA